jgi:HD-GYP domain-containing protein (c-di-GMP phosphodiesterase class II)
MDRVSAALGDFVELKSPYTLGHSSRVADTAMHAAAIAGLNQDEIATLRRAAQAHEIGNVSVPNRVWTNGRRLSRAEWERVRLRALLQ